MCDTRDRVKKTMTGEMKMKRKRTRKYGMILVMTLMLICGLCLVSIGRSYGAERTGTGVSGQTTDSHEVADKDKSADTHETAVTTASTKEDTASTEASTYEDTASSEASTETSEQVELHFDNENCYEGMNKSYSEGYIPSVSDGYAHIVIPLFCTKGALKGDTLSVELNLGDPAGMPFVNKNYRKTITGEAVDSMKHSDDGTPMETALYLIRTELELKPDRINGSYPVVYLVKGESITGSSVEETYTIYVNISDGIDPNAEPTTEAATEATVTYAPKLLVDGCELWTNGEISDAVYAGDAMSVRVIIRNTSSSEAVQNMTVTAQMNREQFTSLQASDSAYVGSILPDGTTELTYEYQVNPLTPGGQYELTLSMDYADSKGFTYVGNGNAKINVLQPVSVTFDKVQIPSEVKVADTVEASITAMNLGRSKVYNVRAVIEGDGLNPQGTIFIGDMEPASNQTASTGVVISHLSGNDSMYGETIGKVTYLYEDETGKEYTTEEEVTLVIRSPFTETDQKKTDPSKSWWKLMGGIGILLVGIIVWTLIHRRIVCYKTEMDNRIEKSVGQNDDEKSNDE